MLGCMRCKQPQIEIKYYVYKSGKDKMTHLGVCKPCYDRARSLKVPKLAKNS